MINSAFKILSAIQRKSYKRRRLAEYAPYTCRACDYEQSYRKGQKVCQHCGTVGELIEWRRIK